MARGPKKHLKRLNAPSHWMLGKLGGVWAPRPSAGPAKLRECLPLSLILRNRLKYALTGAEANTILMQRLVKVDGKVRTDTSFPAGFMDVISIERTKETFRLLYDVKGRFVLHLITKEEGSYKLCKVKRQQTGAKGVPYIATHDARTIRYPDPDIKINDTVRVNIETGKVEEFIKFDIGNICMITGGHNVGRVGIMQLQEKHPGSHTIIRVIDATGAEFSTRQENVFVIGRGSSPMISLPKGHGVKQSILDVQAKRFSGTLTAEHRGI
jgi:small subunit ribosomal protein S4e